MPTAQVKTRKSTAPSKRRYYAEYHYETDAKTDPANPWAEAIGEYSTDNQCSAHRANGDDE